MCKEELAWAGGFFSGEGSTGLSRFSTAGKKGKPRKYWKRYPCMQLAQVGSTETLDRFNHAIGNLGKVRGPYGPYAANKQPYYQFQIIGADKIEQTIAMLWPYLSTAKQEQAMKTMAAFKEQYIENLVA